MTTHSVRVLILEHTTPLADLAAEILQREPSLQIVGAFDSYAALTAQLPHTQSDVVILDLDTPDACGLNVIPFVLANLPDARIILLRDQEDSRYSKAALKLGAAVCVRKDLIATDLVPAVLHALSSRAPRV